jgi:SAM-dependent methyltransferase
MPISGGHQIDSTNIPEDYYDHADGINRCLVCEQPEFDLHREIKHFGFPFSFYRCRNCGLIKQAPMPNAKFFEWFFNSELFFSAKGSDSEEIWGFYDYFKDESSRLLTSKRRFKSLSKEIGWSDKKISLMKIGPSTGTFLHVAQQAGHNVRGCDISDRFAQYARKTYDVKIDIGRYEYFDYKDQQFDAIMLLNVVENVPNLAEFISAIRRTLKIGGHFILNHVEMKNNIIERLQGEKYFIYRPPICYAFEGNTLNHLMQNNGFKLVTKKRDIRYLHLEKITTLLRWRFALKLTKALRISRINFPIWAYPSWISIYERID